MPRRRLHGLSSTFLVVLALLFSQLALASYICAVAPGASQAAMEMPGGEPCEGMDAEQPNLCFQHCSDAPQNFDPLKVPSAAVPRGMAEMPPVMVSRLHAKRCDQKKLSYAPLTACKRPICR